MVGKTPIHPSLEAQDWHHSKCYACGPDNQSGLHGKFLFDEISGEVNFLYAPTDDAIGAVGYLHGGVLAAILDEAQGVLCHHIGHLVMTEKLALKYHKATELNQKFQVRAWLTAVRKRRLYTHASITGLDGVVRVTSKASWYILPDRISGKILGITDKNTLDYLKQLMEVNRKRARDIRKRLKN